MLEVESNNSFASAQPLAAAPSVVSATLAGTADVDFFRVTIPAGRRVVASLPGNAAIGFGMGVYLSAAQGLGQIQASPGQGLSFTIGNSGNSGTTAVTVALRVWRASGGTGAYKLTLTP